MIRTQKERKLQTLMEVITDFASLDQTTTVHQPAEQVFTMEEDDDPEGMVDMMDHSQWTGRGATEPNMSPSLQQMFALARRMGYEMRPITRCTGATRQTPSAPRLAGQGYRAPFRPVRDYSKVKCFSCGNMGHTQARCPKPNSSLPFRPVCTRFIWTSAHSVQFVDQDVTTPTGASLVRTTDSSSTYDREVTHDSDQTSTGLQINHPDITHMEQVDDSVMQISGTGHWFLEGWIGDHSVEFLVDSRSSVTAMPNAFYQALVHAGAPLGVLGPTARTLRSANGTRIGVSGCSHCVVSFLGLQVEFPVLVCDLSTGTDAIIGTDVLGSVLPHTLDIKNSLLFTEGGASLQLHRQDSALSGCVFIVGYCSIPPYSEAVLNCSVRTTGGRQMPSSGLLEGLTLFAENTGLIVGRTLVAPSRWKVPVFVSNFSQDTVVVAPFSEVGMIAQVSAIQSVTEPLDRPQGDSDLLPAHLRDLLSHPYDARLVGCPLRR